MTERAKGKPLFSRVMGMRLSDLPSLLKMRKEHAVEPIEAVEIHTNGNGDGMLISSFTTKKSLERMLTELGLLTPEQLEEALAGQAATGMRLGEMLVERGIVSPQDLAMVVSVQTKIPFVDLKRHDVNLEAIALVKESVARKYIVVPLEIVDRSLVLVMQDPENLEVIQDISAIVKMRIEPALGIREDILRSIDLNYKVSTEIDRQVSQITVLGGVEELNSELIAQTPVVRVVDLLISQAVRDRASDIHIEPQEDQLRIRFRIDGQLRDAMALPMSIHRSLVSRLKILASLNIAERRRPQDGQFFLVIEGREVDIRAATVETLYGEKVELRILNKELIRYTLTDIGFSSTSLATYHSMLETPYGMILVSGPTGSGKTTTLYASINDLHQTERNIMTIEDPVEYRFQGISPIQVNNKAGITFSTGLRALLRLVVHPVDFD